MAVIAWARQSRDGIERWLETERDQLVLWLPVALGTGIAAWFALPDARSWTIAALAAGAVSLGAVAAADGRRLARVIAVAAAAFLTGLVLVWIRAEAARAPVVARPVLARFDARIDRVEQLAARGLVRLRLAPVRVIEPVAVEGSVLPPRLRINLATADLPAGAVRGAVIRLGARVQPPPPPGVPGAYDYARVAWFDGIGGTGRGFGPVAIVQEATRPAPELRARLSAHIQASAPGAGGAIAAALATGDQGAIPMEDADAMRASGLAHLLSVSGLHITAVVGGVMLVTLRLLALSPWLALRVRLPIVAAAAGALAAVGYTLLTGAEVPTVRSCVAALMVLLALVLGRQAVTLRLVAVGAVVVLLVLPEALAGPSFQLSFAAVTAIVALHQSPRVRGWFEAREEARRRWAARGLASLVLTGLAVEAVLSPIALYHFHKAGLYGALANIVAIPLTTFVIMPLEAAALLLDMIGLGAPFWWATARALDLLLWIARTTAEAPHAVAALPAMPTGALAMMVGGGLWMLLWRSGARMMGLPIVAAGAVWAAMAPVPDLLVTGDGRHLAIRTAAGELALLRDRTGDYTGDMLAENLGIASPPLMLSAYQGARCSRDLCLANIDAGGRQWRLLATRSPYFVDPGALIAACRAADIVVSERRLPRRCTPRWLKLDRPTLATTGGVAIALASGSVRTVASPGDAHPWRDPPLTAISRSGAAARQAYPGRAPGADRNAADHKRG